MNDSKARRIAHDLNIRTVDIPAFLVSCKLLRFVNQNEIRQLVEALQEKDRFGFRQNALDQLLS